MQAYLVSDQVDKLAFDSVTLKISALNALFLCFITVQGIIGLLEIRFTQAEIRSKIFLLLGGRSSYDRRRGLASRARFHFAKLTALSLYLCAVMVAIVSPAIFISSVIVNEINTWDYPSSERNDAVGQVSRPQHLYMDNKSDSFQWSPWVGATFVLVAEAVQKFHQSVWRLLLPLLPPCLVEWVSSLDETKFEHDPSSDTQDKDKSDKSFNPIERLSQSVKRSISRSWERVNDEWKDFWWWCKDPFLRSQQPHFRYSKKGSDLSSTEGSHLAPKSANIPSSWSNSSLQSPEPSVYQESDSSSMPLLRVDTRRTSRQPAPYDPGFPDEAVLDQETIHRSTFDRRTSSQ